jgi:hypothetical protein
MKDYLYARPDAPHWEDEPNRVLLMKYVDELDLRLTGLGHAWRVHNGQHPQFPLNLEMALDHLITMNQKLTREQPAAVSHFSCILALMTMLEKWRMFMHARVNWCSNEAKLVYTRT